MPLIGLDKIKPIGPVKDLDELVRQINERLVRFLALNAQKEDYGPTQWIDYSNQTTVTGWTTPTTELFYQKRGNIVKLFFYITGTSNAITASCTLPFTSSADLTYYGSAVEGMDNSVQLATPSWAQIDGGTVTLTFYSDTAGTGWTAANTKYVFGQIEYKVEDN